MTNCQCLWHQIACTSDKSKICCSHLFTYGRLISCYDMHDHKNFCNIISRYYDVLIRTSLARCMYTYVNTLHGDPLQSRFKEIQSQSITMPVIIDVCQVLTCCQSTYFMLHHHFHWSYCSVYMLHTGPPLPDLLLAWPQHQGRELCVQHTPLAQHCMAWYHAYVAISIRPPWKRPPPDHYWLHFAIFGNRGQFSV